MKSKKLFGFEFVEIGEFFINSQPCSKRYSWNDIEGGVQLRTCLNLEDENYFEVQESAYFIQVDSDIFYVGEFANTLKQRWIKKKEEHGCFIWHTVDELITKKLESGHKVTFWLMKNPIIRTDHGEDLNIAKSVEYHLLKNQFFEWNKRGNGTK